MRDVVPSRRASTVSAAGEIRNDCFLHSMCETSEIRTCSHVVFHKQRSRNTQVIWCRILRLKILREITLKTLVQVLRKKKGGGGQFSSKYRNAGSIWSTTYICWNFLKSVVLGIWYKQHYMVNVISVSALALRARAETRAEITFTM